MKLEVLNSGPLPVFSLIVSESRDTHEALTGLADYMPIGSAVSFCWVLTIGFELLTEE